MHKKFFMIAVVLLAVAAGLVTSASALPGKGFGHRRGMLARMTKTLNLTEAQQTQIKGIMTQEQGKIKPLTQQLRQNAQAQNATVSGTFDEAKARAFAGKQAQIITDLMVEKQRMKSEIYAVLTPEQQ